MLSQLSHSKYLYCFYDPTFNIKYRYSLFPYSSHMDYEQEMVSMWQQVIQFSSHCYLATKHWQFSFFLLEDSLLSEHQCYQCLIFCSCSIPSTIPLPVTIICSKGEFPSQQKILGRNQLIIGRHAHLLDIFANTRNSQ